MQVTDWPPTHAVLALEGNEKLAGTADGCPLRSHVAGAERLNLTGLANERGHRAVATAADRVFVHAGTGRERPHFDRRS